MRLSREIPQFVPICGKRIRLYYRGITKQCTNCFGPHTRKVCTSEKVPWIQYVSDFMSSHDHIPREYYGKWDPIVRDWLKNPGDVLKTATPGITAPLTQTPHQASPPESASATVEPTTVGATTQNTSELAVTSKHMVQTEEEVGRTLSKLRSLGMDVTPTLIRSNKDTKTTGNKTGCGSGRGRRKTSLT